jgi:hypothetical protein
MTPGLCIHTCGTASRNQAAPFTRLHTTGTGGVFPTEMCIPDQLLLPLARRSRNFLSVQAITITQRGSMVRAAMMIVAVFACIAMGGMQARSQAGKQLDQKAKDMQSAEQKSWQQVDQINNESDNTKGRLQQSRQSAIRPAQQGGSTVTKTRVGTGSAYKKSKPTKSSLTKKK